MAAKLSTQLLEINKALDLPRNTQENHLRVRAILRLRAEHAAISKANDFLIDKLEILMKEKGLGPVKHLP